MAERKAGIILNVSSMNAFRPLTRIAAYSAAKAGVSNFTQWLAMHMAQEYSGNIRVNAIAPGFFLGEQNRYLLTDKETGKLTAARQSPLSATLRWDGSANRTTCLAAALAGLSGLGLYHRHRRPGGWRFLGF